MPASTELKPLPPDLNPRWEQVRVALTRAGEPDWVPFLEIGLSRVHKGGVLRRPAQTVADDLAVAQQIGQPLVVANLGLHNAPAVLEAMQATHVDLPEYSSTAAVRGGDIGWIKAGERRWAHGQAGAIRSEADFEAFPWPDPDKFDFSVLDEMQALLPEGFKAIVAVGKVFNLGWWLMGFDTYAYALADQPALVERLHAKIAQIQTRTVERALDYPCVGLVWHADDMAYRTDLMVSPALLRKQIFPVYRHMCEMCHQQDVLTVFHSDGNMDRLIEDIIQAGFDAFNPIEPVAMDIRALKKQVEGRLSLIGNVDLSYTLTRGTPEEVRAEVRDLIRDVAPGGGYGLASANSIPEYVPWENFVAMHAAWLEYGRYPIRI